MLWKVSYGNVRRSRLHTCTKVLIYYLLVIRGAGLAYGANIDQDLESGLVYYRVYKAPDSFAAFEAAKDLINKLVSGEVSKVTSLTSQRFD